MQLDGKGRGERGVGVCRGEKGSVVRTRCVRNRDVGVYVDYTEGMEGNWKGHGEVMSAVVKGGKL